MATKIQIRNDISTNWSSVNPILMQGEEGVETNTKKYKVGDGLTAWNSLPYFNTFSSLDGKPTTASGYGITDVYTKTAMQTNGSALMHWNNITNKPNFADSSWKTAVATKESLPLTGNILNDQRVVLNDGDGKQAIYLCRAITGDVNVQWAKTADVDWMTEEQTRITQENARVSAETSRITLENNRVSNESSRQSNETVRQNNESTRSTAEINRIDAETLRDTDETERISMESTRQNNETTRQSKETIRQSNEVQRESAEDIRQSTFEVNEADRSAWNEAVIEINEQLDIMYTQQEAVQKFSYLDAALGNTIQFTDMIEAVLAVMEIRGETVPRRVVFTPNTVRIIGGANWTYTAGASITFQGFPTLANNKTVVLTSVSGDTMTFPAATFTAATELQGTISDGTNTVNIAVSPDNPQTLTSLTSFDYFASGRNLVRQTNTFPQTNNGITCAYNAEKDEYTLNGTATAKAQISIRITTNRLLIKANKYYTNGIWRVSGTNTGDVNFYSDMYNASTGAYAGGMNTKLSSTYQSKFTSTTLAYDIKAITIFSVASGAVLTNLVVKISSEVSDTLQSSLIYEPPLPSVTSLPITISLKDTSDTQLEAREIPDVAVDKVVKDSDRLWKLMPTVYKHVFTGAENISIGAGQTTDYVRFIVDLGAYIPIQNVGTSKLAMANKFKMITANECAALTQEGISNWYTASNSGFSLCIAASRVTGGTLGSITAQNIKDLLAAWNTAESPLIAYGVAKPPVAVELCAADQTALNSVAKTFGGLTNISISDSKGQVYAVGAKNPAALATKTEVALKADKKQEDWITPTLLNGWTEVSGYPVRYMKDNMGYVHVKGRVTGGTINTSCFNLPDGYRPIQSLNYASMSNSAFAVYTINSFGSVIPSIGSTTNFHIDNAVFKAEA